MNVTVIPLELYTGELWSIGTSLQTLVCPNTWRYKVNVWKIPNILNGSLPHWTVPQRTMRCILGWKICLFTWGTRSPHNVKQLDCLCQPMFSWPVGAFMLDICCSPALARIEAVRPRGGNASISNGALRITLCARENKRGHWEFAHKARTLTEA